MRVLGIHSTLIAAIMTLSVLQVYLFSISGSYFSLYFFFMIIILMSSAVIWAPIRIKYDNFSIVFLFLIFVEVSSLAWSPSRPLGVREILFTTFFLVVYLLSFNISMRSPIAIYPSLMVFSVLMSLHSVLVITFRIFPSIESDFIFSAAAKIFINPNSVSDYLRDLNNNVNDPAKAGGFFLNANTGAVLSELGLYTSLIAYNIRRSGFSIVSAFMCATATLFSGSKSAVLLLVAAPYVAYVLLSWERKSIAAAKVLALLFLGCALALGSYIILQDSGFEQDAAINAERRAAIREFAYQQMTIHPLTGHGFGGWPIAFYKYGASLHHLAISEDMPAHNSIIILWSESGMLAAIAGVILVLIALFNIRVYSRSQRTFWNAFCVASVLISVFVHSLGENFGLFKEPHIQVPFAILLGWISAGVWRNRIESNLASMQPEAHFPESDDQTERLKKPA